MMVNSLPSAGASTFSRFVGLSAQLRARRSTDMNNERFHIMVIAAAHGGIAIVALTLPVAWLAASLELVICGAYLAMAFRSPPH
jgi:hypothetical protein